MTKNKAKKNHKHLWQNQTGGANRHPVARSKLNQNNTGGVYTNPVTRQIKLVEPIRILSPE
jgi:hypothetical protein